MVKFYVVHSSKYYLIVSQSGGNNRPTIDYCHHYRLTPVSIIDWGLGVYAVKLMSIHWFQSKLDEAAINVIA